VRVASVEQPKSNEMIGAELGYRYVDSPIVCDIPGGPSTDIASMTEHVAGRASAARLARRRPRRSRTIIPYEGYTLLRLGRTKHRQVSALEKSLRAFGAPLAVLDVPDDAPRQVYGHDLLLLHGPTCTSSGAAISRRRIRET